MGSNAVYQIVLESAVDTVLADGPEAHEIQARAHLVSVLSYEIASVARGANPLAAWEMIENGRYMPRRIRGSFPGRELG